MKIEVNARFKINGWDEVPFSETEGGGKLTKASVKRIFDGDLKGEGKLEYLMVYNSDGSAVYTGFERISGELLERSGTFVLKHEGTFKDGIADAVCTIVNESGTAGLAGISGQGSFSVGHAADYPMTLQVEFI